MSLLLQDGSAQAVRALALHQIKSDMEQIQFKQTLECIKGQYQKKEL